MERTVVGSGGVRVRFTLLGPVQAWRDDQPLDIGGPKQRAVLTLLLLSAGRVVSADRLLQAVWGDDPPGSATAGLHAYISNLRRTLRDGPGVGSTIVRRPPGYVLMLAEGDEIDLLTFERAAAAAQRAADRRAWSEAVTAAETALRLAQQPLAVDFADEDWVVGAAHEVGERRSACAQTLVTALLGAGREAAALAAAQDLAARSEPHVSERTTWLLMMTLYRSGRGAQALAELRRYAVRLDEDLGLEPGPALRDLQGAILRQEPDLAHWPHPSAASVPPVVEPAMPAGPAGPAPDESELVGRQKELGILRALLRDAPEAGPRWLVLTGPAGIGKTALAAAGVDLAGAAGFRILRANCPDDDALPAWWPIRQMLQTLDLPGDPDDVLAPPPGVDADRARFVVYDRIRSVVARLSAERPLLIVVEDAHWADPATLRFMTYVAQAEQPLPLAVVVTVRDGERAADLDRLLAAVARRPGSQQLAVPPLSRSEVAELAVRVTGRGLSVDETDLLVRRTGGNPFFVGEFARLPAAARADGDLPDAVRSVVVRRLRGVDPRALPVLRAAAVLGGPLDLGLLAQVGRTGPEKLLDILEEAEDEGILTVDQHGRHVFAHALLREAILADLPDLARRRLHLRAAQASGSGSGGERAGRRAGHLLAALPLSDPERAQAACRSAAEQEERSWHYDSAATWWQHALRAFDLRTDPRVGVGERDELLIGGLSALAHTGRGQGLLDAVDDGLLDAIRHGRTGSAGRLAATLLRSTGAWPWPTYGTDPGPLLSRIAGAAPLVHADPGAQARLLAALGVGSCYDPDESVPATATGRALQIARALGDPDVLADALLGRLLTRSGVAASARETVALAAELAAIPHRLERIDDVLRHNLLTMAALTLGRPAEAAEHTRLGALGADALRMPVSRVQFRWASGANALWAGDLDRAGAIFAEARSLHAQTELYEFDSHLLAELALRWQRGEVADLDPGRPTTPIVRTWFTVFQAAAAGAPGAAARLAAEVERSEPLHWLTLGRWTLLAHAAADLGAATLAPRLQAELEPYADLVATIGQVGAVSTVALAQARLCALAGDTVAARGHLGRATALADRTGAGGEQLRCRLLALELQRRDGRPATEAAASLADRARSAGFPGIARRADLL